MALWPTVNTADGQKASKKSDGRRYEIKRQSQKSPNGRENRRVLPLHGRRGHTHTHTHTHTRTRAFRQNSQQLFVYLEPIKIYNFPPASRLSVCLSVRPSSDVLCPTATAGILKSIFIVLLLSLLSPRARRGREAGLYVASFPGCNSTWRPTHKHRRVSAWPMGISCDNDGDIVPPSIN